MRKTKEEIWRDSLSNWLKVGEDSGRSRTGLQPQCPPSGCFPISGMEIFGDIISQMVRIQALTHRQSHILPPVFNGCIYVAEQGQPEGKLEVSCAAHPCSLLKHLQAGSRATLLILPGTKAQEHPTFSSMFMIMRVRVPARGILRGFTTTTEATGIRLSSLTVGTSKAKPEQTEGLGVREEILVTRAKSQSAAEFEGFDQEEVCCLWQRKYWLGVFLAFSLFLSLLKVHVM